MSLPADTGSGSSPARLVCLSHVFTDGMPAFPGDPSPQLTPLATVEREGYTAYRMHSGLHVGTHVDAPIHMVPGGKYIDDFPPEAFTGPGRLLDVRGRSVIDEDTLAGAVLEPGDILLLLTGHSRLFGGEAYYRDHPLVTERFARALSDRRIKALGMDLPSPDRYPFEVHHLLLGRDILLFENLTNLEALLPVSAFRVHAFPPRLHAEAAPVNVVAAIG
ncbi:MAG: cyclase family protein [Myxococcaceae bacterium]|nr:cyclase family protein [Myxococcaceae bacterium]